MKVGTVFHNHYNRGIVNSWGGVNAQKTVLKCSGPHLIGTWLMPQVFNFH